MNKLRGHKEMMAKLSAISVETPERIKRALYLEAQIEVTEMKRRTPVDTTENAPHPGNLRNSIHAEEPVQEGKRIYVTVATGPQAPYAIYVHENPDAFHQLVSGSSWKV